jgi:hypothetical protein
MFAPRAAQGGGVTHSLFPEAAVLPSLLFGRVLYSDSQCPLDGQVGWEYTYKGLEVFFKIYICGWWGASVDI